MAKLSATKIDSNAEIDGIWTTYDLGIRLKIARLGNQKYREYMRKIGRPHQLQIQHGTLDDATMETLSREAVAHTILLDWENVEDEDGNALKYTPELGEELFKDTAYYDMLQFVVAFASKTENYRARFIKESLGNLSSASAGTSNGEETLQ